MGLFPQPRSTHNNMLGKLIPHPSSTNFDDDIDGQPPSKRLKRFESTDTVDSQDDLIEGGICHGSPPLRPRAIPDSEEDDGEEDVDDDKRLLSTQGGRLTELETALPSVKTDKQAIADYEAHKAGAGAGAGVDLDREGRLDQRRWTKGKSSIYVDAFNLALETVLEDEAHLFDEAEMAVFGYWRALDYEAQYL